MRSGLPLQIPLRKGFSLTDVIDEMAVLLNVPTSSCIRILQLQPGNGQRLNAHRPLKLNESECAIFAHLFHAQIDQINEMTLQYFVKRLLRQTRGKQSTEHHELLLERALGFNHTTTRICPACISEGRPRRLVWQTRWMFACTRHKVLLVDRCPSCGEPPASRRRFSRIPKLYCCDNHPTRSERCAQRLDLIPTVSLSKQENMLWAQHRLEACLQGQSFSVLGKYLPAINFLWACGDLAEILIPILNADSPKGHAAHGLDQPEISSLNDVGFPIKPIDSQAESRLWKSKPIKNLWTTHSVVSIAPVILSLVSEPNLQSLEDAVFDFISEACSRKNLTPQEVADILQFKLNQAHRSHFHILFQELLYRVKRQYRLFEQLDLNDSDMCRLSGKCTGSRQEFTQSKGKGGRNVWPT